MMDEWPIMRVPSPITSFNNVQIPKYFSHLYFLDHYHTPRFYR